MANSTGVSHPLMNHQCNDYIHVSIEINVPNTVVEKQLDLPFVKLSVHKNIEQNQSNASFLHIQLFDVFCLDFSAFSNDEDSECEEDDGAGHQSYVDDNSANGPATTLGRSLKSM